TLTASAVLTSGTFKLRFRGLTTTSLNYNATYSQIQSALEALTTIGVGNVICSGGPINTAPVQIIFLGALGAQEIDDLVEIVEGTLNPRSVDGTIEVNETRQGDGTFIEIQALTPSGTLTAGTFKIVLSGPGGAGLTASLNYNATALQIQTAIRAVTGFGSTLCFGGPITSTSVSVHFSYSVPLDLKG